MLRDRPFARAFALAALVHLCAVGAVAYGRTRAVPGANAPPLEITIDESAEPPPPVAPVVPEPPIQAPPPPLPPSGAVASLSPRPLAPRPTSPSPPETPPSDVVPLVAAPDPSASASAEQWSAPVFRPNGGGLAQLGLTPEGRAHALQIPGGPGDRSEPEGGHDVGGMGAMLAAEDLARGMGRGGPLVSAIEDVTAGSRAPVDGAASFVIDANEKGEVTSVRAVDVSSDEEAWREVAALLLAKMKGRPLRMRPGWHGLSVTLQVRSHLQLADGKSARGQLPVGARVALFPLKVLSGNFDVTELSAKEFRRIDAWEADERPR